MDTRRGFFGKLLGGAAAIAVAPVVSGTLPKAAPLPPPANVIVDEGISIRHIRTYDASRDIWVGRVDSIPSCAYFWDARA